MVNDFMASIKLEYEINPHIIISYVPGVSTESTSGLLFVQLLWHFITKTSLYYVSRSNIEVHCPLLK